MNKIERQEIAKKMREFAKSYLAHNLRQWRDDASMIKMFRADASDFRRIAALIRIGKIKEAGRIAYSMDTAPRERIPQAIWNLVCPRDN